MLKTVFRWVLNAIILGLVAWLLKGIHAESFTVLLIATLALGVFNLFIRPVLLLLTLPINILTFGLFSLVINALMFMLAARVVPGFEVDSFAWAIGAAAIYSIFSSVFNIFLITEK